MLAARRKGLYCVITASSLKNRSPILHKSLLGPFHIMTSAAPDRQHSTLSSAVLADVDAPEMHRNFATTTSRAKGPSGTRSPTKDSSAPLSIEDIHRYACERGEMTYIDPPTGYTVITEFAHKKRGKCCGNACRHCPYEHCNVKNKR